MWSIVCLNFYGYCSSRESYFWLRLFVWNPELWILIDIIANVNIDDCWIIQIDSCNQFDGGQIDLLGTDRLSKNLLASKFFHLLNLCIIC